MVELAISGNDAFELCRFEAERPEVSYTVETLWYLIENESVPSNPEERFLILGADMFNDFPHWKDAKTLAKMITPLVAFRPDFEKPAFEKYAELAGPEAGERCRRLAVPMPQIEISSSQIRRNILKGKSIRYMVSDPVEREIRKNGLYRETSTR